MRRQWALYGAWGCDLEYTLRERELDDRRLGRTWVEYAKFMIKLKAPCTHGLQDKDLFPGPVRCAACRYRIQQLVYDMNFKLTQLESACKQEGPWKVCVPSRKLLMIVKGWECMTMGAARTEGWVFF